MSETVTDNKKDAGEAVPGGFAVAADSPLADEYDGLALAPRIISARRRQAAQWGMERFVVLVRWVVIFMMALALTPSYWWLPATGIVLNGIATLIVLVQQRFTKYRYLCLFGLRAMDMGLATIPVILKGPDAEFSSLYYMFLSWSIAAQWGWGPGLAAAGLNSGVYLALNAVHSPNGAAFATSVTAIGQVAAIAVGAVVGATRYNDVQKHISNFASAERLATLNQVGSALASTLDVDDVLDLIVNTAIRHTGASSASLMLVDPREDVLVLSKAVGLSEDVPSDLRIPVGTGVAGWVAEKQEPVLLHDISRDPRFSHLVPRRELRSAMCVPLVSKGKTLGVLNVSTKGGTNVFDYDDLDLLVALAAHATVALVNARLFDEIQRASITDGLTNLFNARHFHEQLEAEIVRAKRYGYPVSLFMFDIDHFKQYNDTFGHLEGDRVLRDIGTFVLEEVRRSDVPARYGGEEFMIMLPHTFKPDAIRIANRVRERLKQRVAGPEAAPDTPPSISGGVATFPDDAQDAEGLLRAADLALYRAKASGRDCIRTAEPKGQLEL